MAKAQGAKMEIPFYTGWRPRVMRKRCGKGGHSPKSQTPGKTKGKTCTRNESLLSSYMAKRNRSWKHKMYSVWSQTIR